MPTLYIVATPIGNLEDISFRAIRILSEVDFVLCEDTRVTKVLLDHYKINTPTMSYHQHSDLKQTEKIIAMLDGGKNIALVSDAGTPGISDPGGKLVQAVLEKLGDDIKAESVPGPSAATAALSISGIPTDKFVFMGFPPHKKGRQTFISKILDSEYPVVVYESKHRIIKFLEELKSLAKEKEREDSERIRNYELRIRGRKELLSKKMKATVNQKFQAANLTSVVVCRELSKMHETVYRGDIETIIEKITADKNDQKGEFTVIIGK